MLNIIIATAIMWVLTALFVVPLTNYLVGRKLKEPAYVYLSAGELDEFQKVELGKLYTKYYILSDVLVLGIAGFIGGILGYWFIGISFKAKGWPGLIAFIATSFAGLVARSNLTS